MKKKNFCTVLALAFFIMSAVRVSAQVTIGDNKTPETFSQLEIVSGNKTGLRLPQITTTAQRDAMFTNAAGFKTNPLSKGLQIFNEETGCVETWNGTKWIRWCDDATSGTTSATAMNANNNPVLNINTEINPPIVTHSTTGATGIGTPSGLPSGVTVSWVGGEIIISGTPTEAGTFEYSIPLIGGNGTETATGTITVGAHTADTSGNYWLTGKMCYDVALTDWAEGNVCMPLAGRNNDFATFTFDYTFNNSTSFSNLTFNVTGADANIITNAVKVEPNICRITFKSDIRSPQGAQGRDKVSALKFNIVAIYKDNTNAEKQVTLDNISVQDCTCGCSVKTTDGGWLTFMCYNLGVTSTNVQTMTPAQQAAHTTPEDNYGDLYQWGRVADGHQIRTSETVSGPATAFDANSQASASTHKGKFIMTGGDWRSPQNDNLWKFSTYPANNPCPEGWRVPSITELRSIANGNTVAFSSGSTTSGNYWQWNIGGTPGWLIYPNTTGTGAPTLFLPAAGYRSVANGSLSRVGMDGYYYSTSFFDSNAYYLNFISSTVYPERYNIRGYGYSVRCVAE